jgi:hypothetical protein
MSPSCRANRQFEIKVFMFIEEKKSKHAIRDNFNLDHKNMSSATITQSIDPCRNELNYPV